MVTEPVSGLRASRGVVALRRLALVAAMGLCLSPIHAPAASAQTAAPESVSAPQPPVSAPAPVAAPQAAPAPITQTAPASAPVAQPASGQDAAPATAPTVGAPEIAQPAAGETAGPQVISPVAPLEGGAVGNPVITEIDTETEILPEAPSLEPAEGLAAHDLSPWGMYQQADIVVKAVMIGLVVASLVTWTVWVAKSFELSFARRRVRKGLDVLRKAQTLPESEATFRARNFGGTVPQLVHGALDEAQRSADLPAEGIKERAEILLHRIEARAGRRMGFGTGVLASIGSVAPFVGLFGTVWGIMNSFISIAKTNTTNLAVVAPGIAEALLATAIGLVAAIPAVIIYNMFARSISGYRALLGDASAEVLRHLSRDLDRAAAGGGAPRHARVTGLRAAAE